MNLIENYNAIQKKIDICIKHKKPVPQEFYREQFVLLTQINDTFEKEAIEDISCYERGLRYNVLLKRIADKIGKPVEKYVEKIKDYAFKLTGEELTEEEKRSINI